MSSIGSKNRQCCWYGEKAVHVNDREQQGQQMAIILEQSAWFRFLEYCSAARPEPPFRGWSRGNPRDLSCQVRNDCDLFDEEMSTISFRGL
jgi:hypothetical protein